MLTQYKKTWLTSIVLALILPSGLVAQGIVNTNGTTLVANNSVYLVINNGGFKNDGTFTAGTGTVSFTGNTATANSFISGTSATSFNNLTLNKTSNGLQLNRNISVSGIINFQNGDSLFLNNYNIDLSNTGSISGETNSKRITGRTGGYVQISQLLNAPAAVNPGNIGLEITSAANLGNTIIRRGNQQQSGASVNRYFDIIPTNNSSLNATINFFYHDAELAGIAEGNLAVFSSSNGGTQWTNLGEDGIDQLLNYVTKNGFDQFNRLTLSNMSQVLAVHLLQFNALLVNRQTLLQWTTANEFNSDHFEIERSVDGVNFMALASVTAAGNSTSFRSYQYTDSHPTTGVNYYRLKEVDIDGQFTYSKLVLIKLNQNGDPLLSVYPNPARQQLHINFLAAKEENCLIELFDVKGRLVGTKKIHLTAGVNDLDWDVNALPAGIYTLKFSGTSAKSIRFIKGNN